MLLTECSAAGVSYMVVDQSGTTRVRNFGWRGSAISSIGFHGGVVSTARGVSRHRRWRGGLRPSSPASRSPKVSPIQRPVLHRLGYVRGVDSLAPREVGDGAGDFEDAVVGAGGEAEAFDGGEE